MKQTRKLFEVDADLNFAIQQGLVREITDAMFRERYHGDIINYTITQRIVPGTAKRSIGGREVDIVPVDHVHTFVEADLDDDEYMMLMLRKKNNEA